MGRLVAVQGAITTCSGVCCHRGSSTLMIEDKPAILQDCDCHSGSQLHPSMPLVVAAVPWVRVDGLPLAVVGSLTACGCPISFPNQSTMEIE
ncbi:MAG: hypothetical protein IPL40_06185 [Proteobacteria bacterium]|nr:hypothetical protein [Pseudomonadota bacterium]